MRIEVVKGNIVEQEVDAIVNAAHEGLCGVDGVDGAIHLTAGSIGIYPFSEEQIDEITI